MRVASGLLAMVISAVWIHAHGAGHQASMIAFAVVLLGLGQAADGLSALRSGLLRRNEEKAEALTRDNPGQPR